MSESLSVEFRNAVVEFNVYRELINECEHEKYSSCTLHPVTRSRMSGGFSPRRGVSLSSVAEGSSRYIFYFTYPVSEDITKNTGDIIHEDDTIFWVKQAGA